MTDWEGESWQEKGWEALGKVGILWEKHPGKGQRAPKIGIGNFGQEKEKQEKQENSSEP